MSNKKTKGRGELEGKRRKREIDGRGVVDSDRDDKRCKKLNKRERKSQIWREELFGLNYCILIIKYNLLKNAIVIILEKQLK